MHDDALERRVRAVLHAEAASQPFTITAPELERRAALRGRSAGNRRLTLLLAAALAIGALGVTGVVGGLFDDQSPVPSAPVTADGSAPPTTRRPTPVLPSLDEIFALNRGTVLVAQAHGPADRTIDAAAGLPLPFQGGTYLGTVQGGGEYLISIACLANSPITLDVRVSGGRGLPSGPDFSCDGGLRDEVIRVSPGGTADVSLVVLGAASWRIVVRGDLQALPLPTENPILPAVRDGLQELARLDDGVVESTRPWGESGLRLEAIDTMPARIGYDARIWCPFGKAIRLVLGSDVDGVLTATTETHLACDGTLHDLSFVLPYPTGSQLFVAADPATRFSVVVASESPPIELMDQVPGWQLTTGFGPHLSFDATPHALSGIGSDGGGRVGLGFACSGSMSIGVTVELGEDYGEKRDRFVAPCTLEGATTFQEFEVPTSNLTITYAEPPGTWTAQSFFVPASPTP